MVAYDLRALLREIDSTLREPPAGGASAVARVERTLTDGYARALALEAEQLRGERRLAELARGAGEGAEPELAELADRLEQVRRDLALLRDRLESLRRHAAAVRAA